MRTEKFSASSPAKRYFSRTSQLNRHRRDDPLLENGKEQQNDNLTLSEDQKQMRQSGEKLEQAIKLGQLIDHKLEYKLAREIPAEDPQAAFGKRSYFANVFRTCSNSFSLANRVT